MLKILHIVTQSELGGAQRYIFDLASNLDHNEFNIAVAAGGDGKLFEMLNSQNIQSFKLNKLVRQISPINDVLAIFEIKKLVKKYQPDILHLHSSKAGVVGAIAGRISGVKRIVYTVHGFVFNEPLPEWKKSFYKLAEKFSAKYKDKLICVSDFDRQVGIKNGISAEKLITITNGINEIDFLDKNKALERVNLPQDKIIVGTIANFYLTKGLSFFIDAAKNVSETHKNTLFVIIGDGQLRQDLKRQIKEKSLENKFLLLGSIPEAYKYLKSFDIYICSSVKEGFPFSILEAMQAELPIVSTKVGGISEMIINNESGLLIESKNSNQLADGINKLIKDKQLAQKLGQQAKQRVLKQFNLQKSIVEIVKVYKNIK